jgi:lipoprotein-anchoring transpeptidase ErfK/SrfK
MGAAIYPGVGQMKDRMGDAMKANGLSRWMVAASAAMVLGVQAMGQTGAMAVADTMKANAEKRVIVVRLEDRKLALVEDGQVMKVYAVAIGKASTPSPVGTFTIQRRVKNPVYQHDGKTVQPGPANPVGTRWMGLNLKGYGIHGTNEPKSIGKAASHGCIRMGKKDLEEIYEMVRVGDEVELIGQRNEETAQLFGEPQKQAAAEQPVVAVNVAPATNAMPEPNATIAAFSDGAVENGVAVTGNW